MDPLNIQPDDKPARTLLMLLEGTNGVGVKQSIAKYGYTEQRYYQLKKAETFLQHGSQALAAKQGPRGKRYAPIPRHHGETDYSAAVS